MDEQWIDGEGRGASLISYKVLKDQDSGMDELPKKNDQPQPRQIVNCMLVKHDSVLDYSISCSHPTTLTKTNTNMNCAGAHFTFQLFFSCYLIFKKKNMKLPHSKQKNCCLFTKFKTFENFKETFLRR